MHGYAAMNVPSAQPALTANLLAGVPIAKENCNPGRNGWLSQANQPLLISLPSEPYFFSKPAMSPLVSNLA
jgi:hypothetical protein